MRNRTGIIGWVMLLLIIGSGCRSEELPADMTSMAHSDPEKNSSQNIGQFELDTKYGNGALLLSRFDSMSELLRVVRVEYDRTFSPLFAPAFSKPYVKVTHKSGGREVHGILRMGVSEGDFAKARDGNLSSRLYLLLNSPYSIQHRKDLKRIYILARWRSDLFQEGDVAFYDLAETIMMHITPLDKSKATDRDLSEKGYINTFNHITNQAIITSMISERLADFIADAHERYHIPKLITGNFSREEFADIDNGPVDNLVDMINNEWGQELGKKLKQKYRITRQTKWSPGLLANYLNDIQLFYSKAFGIGFEPFFPKDKIVIRFSDKLNKVMHHLDKLGS